MDGVHSGSCQICFHGTVHEVSSSRSMSVHIYEAGSYITAFGINDFGIFRNLRHFRSDILYAAVLKHNIAGEGFSTGNDYSICYYCC